MGFVSIPKSTLGSLLISSDFPLLFLLIFFAKKDCTVFALYSLVFFLVLISFRKIMPLA